MNTPRISAEAARDVSQQSQRYWQRAGEDIAEAYLLAFRDVVRLLESQPAIGPRRRFRHPLLHNLRAVLMPGPFRVHLVFYRIEADTVEIFRVLHGMRDLPRRLTLVD